MATIEDMIKSSRCFGVAYNSRVCECKICEVSQRCQRACENPKGTEPKAEETKATKADTEVPTTSDPDKVEASADEPTHEEKPKASKPRTRKPKTDRAKSVSVTDSKTADSSDDTKATDTVDDTDAEPKKEKPKKHYSPDMPEFKEMTLDQLFDLLEQRTDKKRSEFIDRYKSKSILRMRLIMAIKKTYEVEV